MLGCRSASTDGSPCRTRIKHAGPPCSGPAVDKINQSSSMATSLHKECRMHWPLRQHINAAGRPGIRERTRLKDSHTVGFRGVHAIGGSPSAKERSPQRFLQSLCSGAEPSPGRTRSEVEKRGPRALRRCGAVACTSAAKRSRASAAQDLCHPALPPQQQPIIFPGRRARPSWAEIREGPHTRKVERMCRDSSLEEPAATPETPENTIRRGRAPTGALRRSGHRARGPRSHAASMNVRGKAGKRRAQRREC